MVFSDVAEAVKNFRGSLRQHSVLTWDNDKENIAEQKTVTLVAFALMPNHFHLILREDKENGVATYMQRVQNSYTKYFNIKNETSGHLFQGPYRLTHIKDNEQLLYTSAYIHRNCRELKAWEDQELKYPWSSYTDYFQRNRWHNLLDRKIILDQFASGTDYHQWVKTSGAKDPSTLGVDILVKF